MPHISSHILRHTGCARPGENNVNPKVMQYIMGDSDVQITMNIYNHIAEMSHVEKNFCEARKIKISQNLHKKLALNS